MNSETKAGHSTDVNGKYSTYPNIGKLFNISCFK